MSEMLAKLYAADARFKTGHKAKSGNIVTPIARVSFAHVFKPQQPMANASDPTPKYGVTLLFPAEADLTMLKVAAQEALTGKWGTDDTKWPRNGEGVLLLRSPFRDQGEKTYEGYVKGAKFITVETKQKPGLLNQMGQEITDETLFFSGCWCWATVNAYAYDKAGNKGVKFGLTNLQLIAADEALGGRPRAQSEFEAVQVPVAGAAAGAGAGSIFD